MTAKATRKVKETRKPLSPERIVEKALALVERDGLDAFSTRRLGEELGCEAMSIYHHFPSKAHLMDALVDRVVAQGYIPPGDLEPIERMRQIARGYRALAFRYPKMFQYLALHRMNTPGALRYLSAILDIFFDAGLDAETAARLFRSLSYYLTGAALDETAGYAKGPSAVEPVPDEVVAREYPAVARVGPYFKPQHFDATFTWGLESHLDGIRRAIERVPSQGKRRKAK